MDGHSGGSAGFSSGLVLVSYVVEAMRSVPNAPTVLSWAPEIPIQYVDLNGVKLRYITAGSGVPLVLLHTIRTQLDIFRKVIPELSKHFKVYALDYPGHGFSDIPKVDYRPEVFVDTVSGFLDKLDIRDAIVAGISIGGTIPLILAARQNSRLKKVISINPYDYAAGRGIHRSSVLANLIFSLSFVPIVGPTVMRLRNSIVEQKILEGGVAYPEALPVDFKKELFQVGCRPGHYKAFISLIRNSSAWDKARHEYGRIRIPVLLVYGAHDWSRPEERDANQKAIAGAEMTIVSDAGHFISLDAPDEVIRSIKRFSASTT
ncbi:MAG: alpha/beta hydrolase [Gammaproteobacteria bacterium]|nr:alpha/beta hydrolase [Gammaproteobacteria bacterium]